MRNSFAPIMFYKHRDVLREVACNWISLNCLVKVCYIFRLKDNFLGIHDQPFCLLRGNHSVVKTRKTLNSLLRWLRANKLTLDFISFEKDYTDSNELEEKQLFPARRSYMASSKKLPLLDKVIYFN